MAGTVTGAAGALRWWYHVAATVRSWTITRTEDGGLALSGQIQNLNAFQIEKRPLVFVVATAQGEWRWPVTAVQIAGTTLSASLGPRER